MDSNLGPGNAAHEPPKNSTASGNNVSIIWTSASTFGLPNPSSSSPGTQTRYLKSTPDADDDETMNMFKIRLTYWLRQMMFVSGETAEPSAETTSLVEEIVRQQVIEMLTRATELANRRGSRSIATHDLIFLIRHDKAKVSRLKNFLSWKDVRKNVKDSDDKGGDAGDVGDFEEGAAIPGAGPADTAKKPANKKAKLVLPWEVHSYFSESVPERDDDDEPADEEEEEQNEATLARLASADERTRGMTRDEYVYWSDCRQASFTFRKGKRFKEWAGFGVVTDSKPNDDIVDILGFLTYEIVQTLTEEALRVKEAEDRALGKAAGQQNTSTSTTTGATGGTGDGKKRKRPTSSGGAPAAHDTSTTTIDPINTTTTAAAGAANDNTETDTAPNAGIADPAEADPSTTEPGQTSGGLFEMQEEGRAPVAPKHVREAFRRLQVVPNKYKFMRAGYAGLRTQLRLI